LRAGVVALARLTEALGRGFAEAILRLDLFAE
jgi:hypothetical protein